jgi:hypothetical protein
MGWEDLLSLVERLGVPVALLLLFVYFDMKRRAKDDDEKDGLVERLTALENYQRAELQQMVIEHTTALQNHADASREMVRTAREQSQVHKQLITALRTRPCLEKTLNNIEGL